MIGQELVANNVTVNKGGCLDVKKLYIQGLVKLKIRGKSKDIKIGDNVSINGNIDIRNRENGKIFYRKNDKTIHYRKYERWILRWS